MPTKIEWTDESWNPITGCTKLSEGCRYCYAEQIGKRFQGGFDIKFHNNRLKQPYHWRNPRTIFVCSMSDLFHKDIPPAWIEKIYDIAKDCPRHRFLVLTKRSTRMKCVFDFPIRGDFPNNLWLGVSIENQHAADDRLQDLMETACPNKFVSIEPILGPVEIEQRMFDPECHSIKWVIVGDESGPNRRTAQLDWVRPIRDQCIKAKVPFFFKQWHYKKRQLGKWQKVSMPKLDGKRWNQMPKETS